MGHVYGGERGLCVYVCVGGYEVYRVAGVMDGGVGRGL